MTFTSNYQVYTSLLYLNHCSHDDSTKCTRTLSLCFSPGWMQAVLQPNHSCPPGTTSISPAKKYQRFQCQLWQIADQIKKFPNYQTLSDSSLENSIENSTEHSIESGLVLAFKTSGPKPWASLIHTLEIPESSVIVFRMLQGCFRKDEVTWCTKQRLQSNKLPSQRACAQQRTDLQDAL